MKTTVEIPDALFKQAKRYAAKHDLTFREVVETGLRHIVTEKPSPFRLKRIPFKGSGMVKDFTWDEIRDILYEGHGA